MVRLMFIQHEPESSLENSGLNGTNIAVFLADELRLTPA
jgi:hypothetical protein